MKKTAIILTLCIMASMTSFGQNGLKNGVYEFIITTDSDTLEIGGVKVLRSTLTKTGITIRRTLIVRFYSGGQYFRKLVDLPPEKQTLTFVRELTAEDEEKFLNLKNN